MKKPIETLDDFTKMFFEDEELFIGLCELGKAMIEATHAQDKIIRKSRERIYGIEGDLE